MIKVSVLMSVYKEPLEWLRKSINSVLAQSFQDFEFIIICDNPDDVKLRNFLLQVKDGDSRIVLHFNSINIGLTRSLNVAASKAKGEYLARIDADDFCTEDRLETQAKFLDENPNIDLCHSNCFYIKEDCPPYVRYKGPNPPVSREWFSWHNPVAHSSVMMRARLKNLRETLYNENYRSAQDYELWTFLLLNNKEIAYIDKPLVYYRISDMQISSKGKAKQQNNSLNIRREYILKRLFNEGIIHSTGIKLENVYRDIKGHEILMHEEEIVRILYLFYFTLSKRNIKYVVKYFLDKRKIYLHFPFKYSLYILFHPLFPNRWTKFSLSD